MEKESRTNLPLRVSPPLFAQSLLFSLDLIYRILTESNILYLNFGIVSDVLDRSFGRGSDVVLWNGLAVGQFATASEPKCSLQVLSDGAEVITCSDGSVSRVAMGPMDAMDFSGRELEGSICAISTCAVPDSTEPF